MRSTPPAISLAPWPCTRLTTNTDSICFTKTTGLTERGSQEGMQPIRKTAVRGVRLGRSLHEGNSHVISLNRRRMLRFLSSLLICVSA
jgi:hypothetical protein